MRAAICRGYGTPDMVAVEELPSPALGAGKVRVRVGAAAVNFPDVLLVANEYQVSVPPPFIPGSEFVGVVEEVAEGVENVAVGAGVRGTGLYGASAEEVIVPADDATPIPAGVGESHAAAFGVAYRTAFH